MVGPKRNGTCQHVRTPRYGHLVSQFQLGPEGYGTMGRRHTSSRYGRPGPIARTYRDVERILILPFGSDGNEANHLGDERIMRAEATHISEGVDTLLPKPLCGHIRRCALMAAGVDISHRTPTASFQSERRGVWTRDPNSSYSP
jgi:hypothetical protein